MGDSLYLIFLLITINIHENLQLGSNFKVETFDKSYWYLFYFLFKEVKIEWNGMEWNRMEQNRRECGHF